jgi:hypothetical protein
VSILADWQLSLAGILSFGGPRSNAMTVLANWLLAFACALSLGGPRGDAVSVLANGLLSLAGILSLGGPGRNAVAVLAHWLLVHGWRREAVSILADCLLAFALALSFAVGVSRGSAVRARWLAVVLAHRGPSVLAHVRVSLLKRFRFAFFLADRSTAVVTSGGLVVLAGRNFFRLGAFWVAGHLRHGVRGSAHGENAWGAWREAVGQSAAVRTNRGLLWLIAIPARRRFGFLAFLCWALLEVSCKRGVGFGQNHGNGSIFTASAFPFSVSVVMVVA